MPGFHGRHRTRRVYRKPHSCDCPGGKAYEEAKKAGALETGVTGEVVETSQGGSSRSWVKWVKDHAPSNPFKSCFNRGN